ERRRGEMARQLRKRVQVHLRLVLGGGHGEDQVDGFAVAGGEVHGAGQPQEGGARLAAGAAPAVRDGHAAADAGAADGLAAAQAVGDRLRPFRRAAAEQARGDAKDLVAVPGLHHLHDAVGDEQVGVRHPRAFVPQPNSPSRTALPPRRCWSIIFFFSFTRMRSSLSARRSMAAYMSSARASAWRVLPATVTVASARWSSLSTLSWVRTWSGGSYSLDRRPSLVST